MAAGYPSNVANLGSQNVYIDKWNEFLNNKLSGGGGESLGSAERYENDPRQLFMEWDPEDKIQPEFSDTLPQFIPDDTDETKMTMRLGLKDNRGGNVYYVVGYANRDTGVPETSNTAGWEPSVTTRLVNGSTIRPELVPQDGKERTAGDPPMPELAEDAPLANNIQSPAPSWIEDNMVAVKPEGPVVFEPGAEPKDVLLEGLLPDRTYYAYFVITGSSDVPSEVQIYKFKTDPVSKPIIEITKSKAATGAKSHVIIKNASENMDISLAYKVFTKSSVKTLYPWLETPLRDVLAAGITSSMLPKPYADFTVYDALAEPYNYMTASKDGTATQGKHFPTKGLGEPENYNKAYSVFDLYANNTIKGSVYSALHGDDTTPTTDDSGEDERQVRRGGTWNGADELTWGVPFYVIAMARKDPEDAAEANKNPSERYSFMGAELKPDGQAAADLLENGIGGSLSVDGNGKITGGQITLNFNAELYKNETQKLVSEDLQGSDTYTFFNGSTSGLNLGASTVRNGAAGNSTTITLMLDKENTTIQGTSDVYAQVAPNTILNESTTPSNAELTISSRVVPTEDADNWYYTYYIDVVWTAYDNGLKSQSKSISYEVTKPKPVTPAPPAASGGGTSFTVSKTNTVNGTSRISFDAPLYAGEDTPVTSVNQLAEIADEIKGIDLSQSRIETSEDGTTLVLKLKGKAEDVSLKISGGKLTNSAGEAAEEALSLQIEKRVETNQANMKLNNFYTDISWGDQTWTDKGTNK